MTTLICENARWELLRALASMEDFGTAEKARIVGVGGNPDHWPDHAPLYVGQWANAMEDIALAAREAHALGEIEMHQHGHPNGAMVRITPLGYARSKAHAAIGEASQELSPLPPRGTEG
jgi:hypothetical protein